jgi:hypothetical protein
MVTRFAGSLGIQSSHRKLSQGVAENTGEARSCQSCRRTALLEGIVTGDGSPRFGQIVLLPSAAVTDVNIADPNKVAGKRALRDQSCGHRQLPGRDSGGFSEGSPHEICD